MNRTIFLIDGFNLYHSLKNASYDLGLNGRGTKWLDIKNLCTSYLHLLPPNASIASIYYFTALAYHLQSHNPKIVARHRKYIKCLVDSGVVPVIAKFKEKSYRCSYCQKTNVRHEEKETDVSIAAHLFNLFITDAADTCVLVSGDTDLAPACRVAKELFPGKMIIFAFPYKRKNKELAQAADFSFTINRKKYTSSQFAEHYVLSDQTIVEKPSEW